MVEINWTFQSLNDIENISEFISKDSEKYAKVQAERFFNTVKILDTHPKAGRTVPEISDRKIRELICGNYRIVYKIVNENLIDILTIHHGNRLLSNNPGIDNDN